MLTSQLSSPASAGSSLDACSTSSLIRELIARVAQGEDLSEVVTQLDDLVSLIRERSASQSADDKEESQRSGHRGETFRGKEELNGISERRRAAVDMLVYAPALTHTAALEDAGTAGHCLISHKKYGWRGVNKSSIISRTNLYMPRFGLQRLLKQRHWKAARRARSRRRGRGKRGIGGHRGKGA
jgi:hypothetical protein